jgi:hypothetical protein
VDHRERLSCAPRCRIALESPSNPLRPEIGLAWSLQGPNEDSWDDARIDSSMMGLLRRSARSDRSQRSILSGNKKKLGLAERPLKLNLIVRQRHTSLACRGLCGHEAAPLAAAPSLHRPFRSHMAGKGLRFPRMRHHVATCRSNVDSLARCCSSLSPQLCIISDKERGALHRDTIPCCFGVSPVREDQKKIPFPFCQLLWTSF